MEYSSRFARAAANSIFSVVRRETPYREYQAAEGDFTADKFKFLNGVILARKMFRRSRLGNSLVSLTEVSERNRIQNDHKGRLLKTYNPCDTMLSRELPCQRRRIDLPKPRATHLIRRVYLMCSPSVCASFKCLENGPNLFWWRSPKTFDGEPLTRCFRRKSGIQRRSPRRIRYKLVACRTICRKRKSIL